MGKGRTLATITLLSGLALAGCKNEKSADYVIFGDERLNGNISTSTEYVEVFDKETKVRVEFFYNKPKDELDSIKFSDGNYVKCFNKNNAEGREVLENKRGIFKDYQLKYQINHNLDSIFAEKEE